MTLPDERYRAVMAAKYFLEDLCSSIKTPRVPKDVRERARGVLRHFPSEYELKLAATAVPNIFAEKMEPLYRMVKQHEQENSNE
jgi:hypothetical protein